MSGKTIVIQPRTTQTASPKRLLISVVSVLAVSAAIVFGSMASNESAAVADAVDLRVDYAFRHPPVSDPAELQRSEDYGIRHLADWRALESVTSGD